MGRHCGAACVSGVDRAKLQGLLASIGLEERAQTSGVGRASDTVDDVLAQQTHLYFSVSGMRRETLLAHRGAKGPRPVADRESPKQWAVKHPQVARESADSL